MRSHSLLWTAFRETTRSDETRFFASGNSPGCRCVAVADRAWPYHAQLASYPLLDDSESEVHILHVNGPRFQDWDGSRHSFVRLWFFYRYALYSVIARHRAHVAPTGRRTVSHAR